MQQTEFLQRVLEKRTSIEALNNIIKVEVDETDLTTLLDKWHAYVVDMKAINDNKHKDYHIGLLESVAPEKALRTSMRVLIKAQATSKSYVDRNVVANTIGKKLIKAYKGKEYNKAVVALSLGLNVVNVLATMNLVSYKMLKGEDNRSISTLEVNPNLVPEKVLEKAKEIRANNFMIAKPGNHENSKAGGYYTVPKTMLNSRGFNQIALQSDSTNLAINKLQDVAYSIRGNYENSLIERYRAEDKWFNDAGQFMTKEWMKFVDDLSLAKEREFYFPMSYDDRGRMYESSAYIKYQGDKYQKSMLEFANKETCTTEGLEFLKIALVNEVYSDKIPFSEALEWFDTNYNNMDKLVQDTNHPIAITLWADVQDALAGKPIGTITHWDATNSGLQFYSIIGRDKATASLCNVYNTGTIADAYQALADALNDKTESTKFNRSNLKKAFMTFLYGSMQNRILLKIEDVPNGVTKGIKEFFPTDWSEERMWEAFTESMIDIAPAAIKIMNLLYTYNIEGKTKFSWTMPDGFKVETTSTQTYNGSVKGKDPVKGWFIDHKGKTHEGTIAIRLEEANKFSRSLAPNIIHSIDAYFGREVIRRADFDISFIHDSFGCHPNHAQELQDIVRQVAAEMVEQDILVDILNQLNPDQTMFNLKKGRLSFGDLTSEDIANSKYIVR